MTFLSMVLYTLTAKPMILTIYVIAQTFLNIWTRHIVTPTTNLLVVYYFFDPV